MKDICFHTQAPSNGVASTSTTKLPTLKEAFGRRAPPSNNPSTSVSGTTLPSIQKVFARRPSSG
ncbi:hypothetical protein SESBI_50930 [Sesbania bispinosa]|nr:hypothetical protein SESBI_50930 [Sesbania bispinosa]